MGTSHVQRLGNEPTDAILHVVTVDMAGSR
jgi:hypothetical protein